MLLGLRHRTVGRRHHQDRAIHLRRARDHVLDVVGVARAIHMRVVPVRRLVLHMARRDRDAALPLLGGVVDRVKRAKRVLRVVLRQHLRDRRRQRRLAVINVTNRPYVHVRFGTVKLFLRHDMSLSSSGPARSGRRVEADLWGILSSSSVVGVELEETITKIGADALEGSEVQLANLALVSVAETGVLAG